MIQSQLRQLLQSSWSKETSYSPETWSKNNPAHGQCAVTALIVQDYFGGELVRCMVKDSNQKVSHFYNHIQDKKVDLTSSQFSEGADFSQGITVNREKVLSSKFIESRYKLLQNAVQSTIQ